MPSLRSARWGVGHAECGESNREYGVAGCCSETGGVSGVAPGAHQGFAAFAFCAGRVVTAATPYVLSTSLISFHAAW